VKERLTGAIILVAILVLLVPELLTGPSRSVRTEQPPASVEGAQMRSYTIDLADDAAHRAASPPIAEAPMAGDPPIGDSAAKAGATSADTGSTADPSSALAAAQGTGVQSERSDRALAQSSAVQSDRSGSASPTSSASPASPPASTAAAGEQPKPASAPRLETTAQRASESPTRADSKPTTGWAVQVGSFANRENAERLARQLKGKGFAATVSQSPQGRRLWRVRVGPETDRAAAVALGAKLRAVGQPGAVVPYP
jgi:DedD protein